MRLHLCANFCQECCHECSLGVYLAIDHFLYVPSDALPLYEKNYKAIGQLVMEILHFNDLGIHSVVTNAVVLVLGECHISMATYLWVVSPGGGGGGGVLGIYIGGGVPWHTKKRGVLGAGTNKKGGS